VWPGWLRWLERLILVQAFCSIIPTYVLGRPESGYHCWMHVSLVLVAAVAIRRIVSLRRMRPAGPSQEPDRDSCPTYQNSDAEP
jgi:hypothetical protein